MALDDILDKTLGGLSGKDIGPISKLKFREFTSLVTEAYWNAPSRGTAVLNSDLEVQIVNKAFTEMFQYELGEIIGERLDEIVVGKGDKTLDIIKEELSHGRIVNLSGIRYKKDGTGFWCNINSVPIVQNSEIIGMSVSYSKTAGYHLDSEQQQRMVNNYLGVYFEIDYSGQILFVSPKVKDMLGFTESQMIGQSITSYVGRPDKFEVFLKTIELKGKIENYRTTVQSPEKRIPVAISATYDEQHGERIISGTFIDITEDVEREEKIKYLAERDSLTGAYNRRMITEIGNELINEAKEKARKVSVVFIDVDDMKKMNDNYGHYSTDQVLKEMVKRLGASFHPDDLVGRYGGDEFMVMFSHNHDYSASELKRRCEYIQGSLMDRPYSVDENEISLSISMGVAVYSDRFEGLDDILKITDSLMYRAKEAGKGTFFISDDSTFIS